MGFSDSSGNWIYEGYTDGEYTKGIFGNYCTGPFC
jgi:hypothetical protein